MSLSPAFLVLAALLPLIAGVFLQLLFSRLLDARAKGVLALLSAVPSAVSVSLAFLDLRNTPSLDWTAGMWDGPLALVFHIDALGVMFAAMGTVLGSIVLLYSIGYMAHERAATRFYAFMLTFIAGMVGLVYSANLFSAYACWELMGLCSFSLVGFWYEKKESVAGARKVLLMTHIAGYGLLAAILLLYARTGSALWTDPGVAHAFTSSVYTLMLVALLAKSVQFPLHTWIPEAMNAPTPVSALLHSACYVKAGVYLAARMHAFAPWHASWSTAMMWLGTVTMVVGVVYAMVQHDLKRMLAFHTVSQIGYIITGLGIGTPLGIAAGLLHCLNHSLFKGGLFLAAGSVQHATGTRDMNELGGLSRLMPKTAVVWLVSVGSMMGVPFMSGFASKWLLYTAALQAGQVVPALAAWVVSIGTVFSCVKATSSVFLGPTTAKTETAHEAPATMVCGLSLFALGSIVLGIAPQLAVGAIINPILPLFGMATVHVSWFGLTPSTDSWWTSGGLVLALVSAGVGVLLYILAGASRARSYALQSNMTLVAATGGGGVEVFTGGESIHGPRRLPASEFSAILKSHWTPIFRATDVDRAYLALWNGISKISRAFASLVASLERAIIPLTCALTVAVFLAVHGFAPAALPGALRASQAPLTLLAVSCVAAGAALLIAALALRKSAKELGLMFATLLLGTVCLFCHGGLMRTTLLELASLFVVALLWNAENKKNARLFGTVVVISGISAIAGHLLLPTSMAQLGLALIATGFVVKLGVFPALLWLPALAENASPLVLGTLISVLDIAAFAELVTLTQEYPALLMPAPLWTAAALATSLLASLLMLSQYNLKRLLALSTIEDIGFLWMGLAVGSDLGLRGAIFGAATHALAKALLFASISAPEADGALHAHTRGLAVRYPFSAAGFLVGMLAMLGVPPMLGFAGRWRLYFAALQQHPALLAGFVLSSMLALIAYVLCLTRTWWGAADAAQDTTPHEPLALRAALVALIVLLIAGGLCPEQWIAFAGRLPWAF